LSVYTIVPGTKAFFGKYAKRKKGRIIIYRLRTQSHRKKNKLIYKIKKIMAALIAYKGEVYRMA